MHKKTAGSLVKMGLPAAFFYRKNSGMKTQESPRKTLNKKQYLCYNSCCNKSVTIVTKYE